MAGYTRAVLLLCGWMLVLMAGLEFGVTVLPTLWPWMLTTPVAGLLLGVPVVVWLYLPVPPLVRAGGFEGRKGLVALLVWCGVFLLGLWALVLFQLSEAFLIAWMSQMYVLIMVGAQQWKADAFR